MKLLYSTLYKIIDNIDEVKKIQNRKKHFAGKKYGTIEN
jgi:hypothetical protein